MSPPQLISAREAAQRLDFTVQHVRRLLRNGDLRGTKQGRDWMIPLEAIRDFARDRSNLELDLDES